MNIFVLDADPKLAAQYHNDRHVVKMVLETAQLLSMAHFMLDGEGLVRTRLPAALPPGNARAYLNHACAKWARQCHSNYVWLHTMHAALCAEYAYRYGRHHAYAAQNGVCQQLQALPLNMPLGRQTHGRSACQRNTDKPMLCRHTAHTTSMTRNT